MKFVTGSETANSPMEKTVKVENPEKGEDAFSRKVERLLASIDDVSEDEITPEFLNANLKRRKKEELARARSKGIPILTTEEVKKLARDFDSRRGNREKILEP